MPRTIHATEHHGIPVRWVELPGELTATLHVGVGMADEPGPLLGITHLVEHLVFRACGHLDLTHHGMTGARHVELSVSGEPDEVALALNRIGKVIREPEVTAQDLLLEKRIVETENPGRLPPAAGLLTARYGLESVGNAHAGTPCLPSITLDEARAWIDRWFTTGNSAIALTGPLPEQLDLRLPEGPRAAHRDNVEVRRGPLLIPCEKSGVGLSIVTPPRVAPVLARVVEEELMSALRHERGLIHSVDVEINAVDDHEDQLSFVLDPQVEDTREVVVEALACLRRLASDGVSEHALRTTHHAARSNLSRPEAWQLSVDGLVISDLLGLSWAGDPDRLLAEAKSTTAADVSEALRTALPTLILMVDEDADPDEELAAELGIGWEEPTPWQPTTLPTPRGARSRGRGWGLRDTFTVAGGYIWGSAGGERRRLDLSSVVVAGTFADGSVGLVDHQGRDTILDPADWRKGADLVTAVLAEVPAERHRDFSWFDDPPHRRGEHAS